MIQTKWQAARIVILYGLILPWATTLAVVLLSALIRSNELSRAFGIYVDPA